MPPKPKDLRPENVMMPKNARMYVIDLTYIVPLEVVDPLIDDHISFLKKYYAQNVFIASGAKVPRDGGVILAISDTREKVENLIKEDPFHQNKVARYAITEFCPTMMVPVFGSMLRECFC